jgi:C1A family cysteine protease
MQQSHKGKHIYNLDIRRIDPKDIDYGDDSKIKALKLPASVDLTPRFPAAFDQGALGSCTSQALCALYGYNAGKKSHYSWSRLFLYYIERKIEGTINYDSGATIFHGIRALKKYGVCREQLWQYDISKFKINPPERCYRNAKLHRALKAYNVRQDLETMKGYLAAGNPFVIGIAVYEEFESDDAARTGNIPMPGQNSHFLGGHALIVGGYDDSTQRFNIRNSWGTGWGNNGNGTLPYPYLLDPSLTSDMWYIAQTTDS